MSATTDHILIHIEWWDSRTGNDLALEVARTLVDAGMMVAETMHIYTPDVLEDRAAAWGESSLWLSVRSLVHFRIIKDALRDSMRIKMIGPVPEVLARADRQAFFDWLYADENEPTSQDQEITS
jgi:hypothetical protein